MNYLFDPDQARSQLLNSSGRHILMSANIEECRQNNSIASIADNCMNQAVACLIVGLDEPAYQLLAKAEEWVRIAIEEREVPNRSFGEPCDHSGRLETLTQVVWLRHGHIALSKLEAAAEAEDRCLEAQPAWIKSKESMSLRAPLYLDAGRDQTVIEHFEACGAKPPRSLKSVRTEGQMAWLIARHNLGLDDHTDAQVAESLNAFLTRHVDDWLCRGGYARTARWMKIAYGADRDDPAAVKRCILKCYNHLPHLTRSSA